MNYKWNAEDVELQESVRNLLDAAVLQEIHSLEDADEAEIRRILLKYLGLLARSEYLLLGAGPERQKDHLRLIGAQEELAGASGSLFLAVEFTARLFGGLLSGWGSDALKLEILKPLQQGELIAGIGISEPGVTESGDAWKTSARLRDGVYTVSGEKSMITNGPIADWLAVAGDVDGKTAFFLIKPEQEGLTLSPRIKTMGCNGLAVCSAELQGVRVPESHVIGPFEDDQPLKYLYMIQDLVLASASVGLIKRTHSAATEYAHAHYRGGKPIFSHQEVRFKLADTFTYMQAAQMLTYRTAWYIVSGDKEAPVLVNCAKVFCAESSETVAGLAMQIMAGAGYISGNPIEQGYRDAKYAALAGTTSEVSRMNIADDIIKRFPI